jgi:hypothetical protein
VYIANEAGEEDNLEIMDISQQPELMSQKLK